MLSYYAFKAYLKLMHESLMIRRRHTIGLENIPAKGEKYFIVCNHQNCANDPLNIMFALPFRCRTSAMARADVFELNPALTSFFNWIGMVPAFRLGWEGGDGIEHNFNSFDIVADHVNDGSPFMVFPEAGHTQGHYLDRFTTGTVRMAFYVAKHNDWKDDIKIVPAAHHYEDYFKIQSDFLLTFSEPISLEPYYERFKEHPNTVMREITRMLRSRIQSMMLDEGADDYEEKDFLRQSAINPATTANRAFPEHMNQDRTFVNTIRESSDYAEIIDTARQLLDMEQSIGVSDITVHKSEGKFNTMLRLLLLVILFPVWIVTLLPHVFCYAIPPLFLREDKMFTNTYRYVLSVLVLYPLFFTISVVVGGAMLGWWWQTLVWILLWIPGARICWWYYQFACRTMSAIRWAFVSSSTRKKIIDLRNNIRNIIFRK